MNVGLAEGKRADPYLVGLTGGIGSGKSEVAAAFASKGADVLDADEIAHAVSRRGEAGHRAVVDSLGEEFLRPDGELDRAALRRRAFDDPTFRRDLEQVLHPLIAARLADAIEDFRGPYGILVVPLLLERGGLRKRVSRVLVVDCPEHEQIRRVQLRSGLAADEVRRIMATQLPRAERLAQADDVIDNSGPLGALEPQVARLDRRYRDLAARAGELR
ncbi:MAG TPA: dephospho-CoA kinase [Casimicrobiaceae bacterium]|nr:dephospho-CoA kinase [Casimicrobiaceae bacterium]